MQRALAVFMAVVLAVSLAPLPGYADEAGRSGADGSGAYAEDPSSTDGGQEGSGGGEGVTPSSGGEDASGAAEGAPSEGAADSDGDPADGGGDVSAAGSASDVDGESAGGAAEGESADDGDASGGDGLVSVEEAEAATGISAEGEGAEYAEGEVLVTFSPQTGISEASETVEDAESTADAGVTGSDLVATDVQGGVMQGQAGMDPAAVVEVADDATVVQAIAELQDAPNVESVQPNYLYRLSDDADSEVEESSPASQAVSVDDALDADDHDAWDAVGLYDAWSRAKCEGAVGIAILDTGCNTAHEDLAANIAVTYNAVDGTADVTDWKGHGTHVAGIAGAVANNGVGIAGASYNAKLAILKVFDDDGDSKSSYLVSAYAWIAENQSAYGIRVANASVGSQWTALAASDQKLLDAIDSADAAGVLTVCAAGNSGSGLSVPYACFPGDHDRCLSVMNLSSSSGYTALSSSSNYNVAGTRADSYESTKDVCAPGTSIYSTGSDGGYQYKSGTSMASPLVAGIAALCFAADPSLTPDQVRDVLEQTATDLGDSGWDEQFGYGRVNADAALEAVLGSSGGGSGSEAGSGQSGESGTGTAGGSDSSTSGSSSSGTSGASAAKTLPDLKVSYSSHVQNVGWQKAVTSTSSKVATSGTSGRSLRLEGIKINVAGSSGKKLSGAITYRTHVQNIGWQKWVSDGAVAGTSGRSLRLEAIQIKLKGDYAKNYDVYYRVHAQNVGWMDWAKNGEQAGTAGYSYRLEAIQIVIVKKGANPPTASPKRAVQSHFQSLKYRTHVQNVGWQGWKTEGQTSGTTGRALRVESLKITLGTSEYSGGVTYRAYVQGRGWQAWKKNGAMAGTSGKGLRLEGLQVKLTGEMAKHYHVYYRVHVQGSGWQAWAKDGATAGKPGKGKRIEAVQVKLVPR